MGDAYIPKIEIDRSSSSPLYRQIAKPIEAAILSGDLPPGTLIEDEISMANRLKVARLTARQALQELSALGLITRRRGVGTRVTPPHVHRPLRLSSLNDDLVSAGIKPRTRVISYQVREASDQDATRIEVSRGTGVLSLTRLRYADEHPLALMNNLIPVEIAPDWTQLNSYGLYECLRRRGITIDSASQEIGAKPASSDEAELLEETTGVPLLTMQRIGRTEEGKIVEAGNHLYRPTLYSFHFSLFAT